MRLYCGIDLHSNNSYVVVLDEQDGVVYRRRLRNDLGLVLQELAPFAGQLVGIAVESTFNWYWLVDGLMEAGYRVHLANPGSTVRSRSRIQEVDMPSSIHKWRNILKND